MTENIFVGHRLFELRKLKNITQEQLADVFGISKQAISKWESGKSMPDITLLPEIARFFGVTVDYFFDRQSAVQNRTLPNAGKKVISVQNISKQYNEKVSNFALKDCSLDIFSNYATAIMGASGSGKSTLLNCMSGLEQVTSGKIEINGKEITKLKEPKVTVFRRENICLIFQQYNLVDTLNVRDNIFLPYKLAGERINKKKYKDIISKLGLSGKEKSLPNELSGGQQQRVAIARALLGENKIIFADEPTGALDIKTGQEVLQLLLVAAKQFNQPLVIITHDPYVASQCDIVHFLFDGRLFKTLPTPTTNEINNVMMEIQR